MKTIELHRGKHKYKVFCLLCGDKMAKNDKMFLKEVVKVELSSCRKCSPDPLVTRNQRFYLADGSLIDGGIVKKPDGTCDKFVII